MGCERCQGIPGVVKQAGCLWGGGRRTPTEPFAFAEGSPRRKPVSTVNDFFCDCLTVLGK